MVFTLLVMVYGLFVMMFVMVFTLLFMLSDLLCCHSICCVSHGICLVSHGIYIACHGTFICVVCHGIWFACNGICFACHDICFSFQLIAFHLSWVIALLIMVFWSADVTEVLFKICRSTCHCFSCHDTLSSLSYCYLWCFGLFFMVFASSHVYECLLWSKCFACYGILDCLLRWNILFMVQWLIVCENLIHRYGWLGNLIL